MEDVNIVELYFARNEQAIRETDKKYGKSCTSIAYRIIHTHEDAEECTNDTWIRAWNAMPPERPIPLFPYLAAIVRRLALDCYKKLNRSKRGGGQVALALDELEECVAGSDSVEDTVDKTLLAEKIAAFLETLTPNQRKIFVQRYTYVMSIAEIAEKDDLTESNVKVTLMRIRKALKESLQKEGLL